MIDVMTSYATASEVTTLRRYINVWLSLFYYFIRAIVYVSGIHQTCIR